MTRSMRLSIVSVNMEGHKVVAMVTPNNFSYNGELLSGSRLSKSHADEPLDGTCTE
jgi:hypothetical protein